MCGAEIMRRLRINLELINLPREDTMSIRYEEQQLRFESQARSNQCNSLAWWFGHRTFSLFPNTAHACTCTSCCKARCLQGSGWGHCQLTIFDIFGYRYALVGLHKFPYLPYIRWFHEILRVTYIGVYVVSFRFFHGHFVVSVQTALHTCILKTYGAR